MRQELIIKHSCCYGFLRGRGFFIFSWCAMRHYITTHTPRTGFNVNPIGHGSPGDGGSPCPVTGGGGIGAGDGLGAGLAGDVLTDGGTCVAGIGATSSGAVGGGATPLEVGTVGTGTDVGKCMLPGVLGTCSCLNRFGDTAVMTAAEPTTAAIIPVYNNPSCI
jgi:hypothetical protein